MTKLKKGFRKIIHLSFPPEHSGNPVMSQLVREYDLTFSIIKAQISPRKEGELTVQIEGDEALWEKAVIYLKSHNIRISPTAQQISRDENSCMHCGLCTAMCPAGALKNDTSTRKVSFDEELCSACGLCTRVCPVGAMQVDLNSELI